MTVHSQRLDLQALRLPTSTSRDLLAYLHSGDVLRQGLPRLMRVASIFWFLLYILNWISTWPGIYREFERWGLVKAFFAQLIALVTAVLVTRITLLRAQQIAALPADDFTSLRSMALLLRWTGDIVLVGVVGYGVSSLLQLLGPGTSSLVGALSPSLGTKVSQGATDLLLMAAPVSLFMVELAAGLFLAFYTAGNTIDLGLAIEFNTRSELAGRKAL